MSDEAALLATILAHPDEDTPRLMYADWLQEHGESERAEFIRLQCAPVANEAAEARAAELEDRNRAEWLAGLPQSADARWEFRRGFPESLDVSAQLMLAQYEAFARVPWLRIVSFHGVWVTYVRNFVARSWPAQWSELYLQESQYAMLYSQGGDTTQSVRLIADNPQVSQLRLLCLSSFRLSAAAIHRLATSPHLDSLRHLRLNGENDGPRFSPLRERFGDRLVIESHPARPSM